jgi:NMD protein affecting ribosome stability and mRNA decay
MKEKIHFEIELEQKMSNEFKNRDESYFKLELQIRFLYFNENQIEDLKTQCLKLTEKFNSEINKIKENPNGINIYFRRNQIMTSVSKLFKNKYFCEEKKSKKIIGRDKLRSKDRFKYFLLINIINLNRNDIIEIKGENYKINSIKNQELYVQNIKTTKKEIFTYKLIKDYLKKKNE